MKPCGDRQICCNEGHNCITDDDFLRGISDYTSMMDIFLGGSTDHVTAGVCSENPQIAGLFERISEITKKDKLQEGTSGLPQEEYLPGRAPPSPEGEPLEKIQKEGVSQGGGIKQSEQQVSPKEPPLETPLA